MKVHAKATAQSVKKSGDKVTLPPVNGSTRRSGMDCCEVWEAGNQLAMLQAEG